MASKPIASVKAKPKIVICIKRASLLGLRLKACKRPAKRFQYQLLHHNTYSSKACANRLSSRS